MKAVTEKQLRQVTVLVRYFVKATGSVVLYVENDKGARYYVTLNKNKQHHCSCPSYKRCYHIDRAVELENTRHDAEKAAKAKQSAMSDGLYTKLAALNEAKPAKVVELRSNLNGAQHSAGLLMALPSRQKAIAS